MRHAIPPLAFSLVFLGAISAAPLLPRAGIDWPSFRGPRASGIGDGFKAPTQWNVSAGQNVKWKTPIAGLGHSSPAIWGNLLCVTTAISGKTDPELKVGLYGAIKSVDDESVHTWKVICLDKKSGRLRWERTAHSGVPKVKRHTKSTHANPTVAMDGTHVVAFFGSEGLYGYDMKGKLLWKKDLGVLDSGFFMVPQAQWAFASSPVIDDGRIYLQADVQKDSFLATLDVKTGREIWRTPRNDVPTWSTPAIHHGARPQVIANGFRHIGGYDLKTGKELWRLTGGGDIPVPTPVVAHDLIFITNAHGKMAPIYAIRTSASGDITLKEGETSNEHVAWSQNREGAYMQTPLVYGDYLYNCRDNGVLSVYEARTGKRLYQQRMADGKTGFSASPVAADQKVYFTSEDGDVHVVRAGPAFEELATNSLNEVCMATPAISEGVLFFRTRGHVVAIGR
jgi:outer membrane protein assembly factor BamB